MLSRQMIATGLIKTAGTVSDGKFTRKDSHRQYPNAQRLFDSNYESINSSFALSPDQAKEFDFEITN